MQVRSLSLKDLFNPNYTHFHFPSHIVHLNQSSGLPVKVSYIDHAYVRTIISGLNNDLQKISQKVKGATLLHCLPGIYGPYTDSEEKVGLRSGIQIGSARRIITTQDTKTFRAHIETEMPALYKTVLAPFDNSKVDLRSFMSAIDEKNNNALHYAFRKLPSTDLFRPLLDRIGSLDNKHKQDLAFAVDENKETIFHSLFFYMNTPSAVEVKTIFGAEILYKALQIPNSVRETPLHKLCESKVERQFKLLSVVLTVKDCIQELSAIADEKKKAGCDPKVERSIKEMFIQRLVDNRNPLHITCKELKDQRNEAKNVLASLLELAKMGKKDLFKELIKQQDNEGNTPLHYAAKNINLGCINVLLNDLSQEEQIALILTKNKKGKTAFDYACSWGNPLIVERLIDVIGSAHFFRLRFESDLNKKVKGGIAGKNRSMTMADFNYVVNTHNSIFNLIHYHIKRFIHEKHVNLKDTNVGISARIKDTQSRLKHLFSKKDHLPPLPEHLRSKKYGTGIFTYQGSQRYYELCEKVAEVARKEGGLDQLRKEYDECIQFFSNMSANDLKTLGLWDSDVSRVFLCQFTKEITESPLKKLGNKANEIQKIESALVNAQLKSKVVHSNIERLYPSLSNVSSSADVKSAPSAPLSARDADFAHDMELATVLSVSELEAKAKEKAKQNSNPQTPIVSTVAYASTVSLDNHPYPQIAKGASNKVVPDQKKNSSMVSVGLFDVSAEDIEELVKLEVPSRKLLTEPVAAIGSMTLLG